MKKPLPQRTTVSACRASMLTALSLLATAHVAGAQQANAPEQERQETVVLSPFVVSDSQDTGYAATSSLGGTRINTSLRDIAASISSVTKDMMGDLGVYNSQQLMTYTLGTEVSGPSGSFSGAAVSPGNISQDGVNRDFLPNVRVRGLAAADNTRDYFLTSIPWDGFNTSRVEINRGPNSMLYGTGSPSGIVNQVLITPNLDKSHNEVQTVLGSFGSTRAQVDSNLTLIRNTLAIRTALKYSDDRFMQSEAYIRDKRGFVVAAYRPFALTTLRASFEQGRQSSIKPEWRPPFDLGITAWFNLGKPAYDPVANTVTLLGARNAALAPVAAINADGSKNSAIIVGNLNDGGWGSDAPGLVFTSPNRPGISGMPLYTSAFSGGLKGVHVITNRGPGDISLAGLPGSRQYQIAQHAGLVGGRNYTEQQISDPRIFDFYHHSLAGINKTEGAKWQRSSVAIEQLLPDKSGGVELVLSREQVHTSFCNPFNWETYGIGIDINTKLLDGSANPNFGRPVMASDSWSTETVVKRSDKRATAFYSFAPKGESFLRKLLGTHTLTGNYSDSTYSSVTNGGRALVAGPEWVLKNPNAGSHLWSSNPYLTIDNGASRGFASIVYLGNAATGNTPYGLDIQPVTTNVLLPGVSSVPAMFYNPTAAAWQTTGINITPTSEFNKQAVDLTWTGGKVKSQSKSKVAVLHSKMLWDTLVPTVGYREDELRFWNAPGNIYNAGGYSSSKAPLPSTVSSMQRENSFNWGAVARLPLALQSRLPAELEPSLFFNKSDNFSPTGQRLNIFGQPIAPSQGKTTEYGFALSGFSGKFAVRYTRFETALTGVSQDRRDAFHTLLRNGAAVALADIQAANSNNVANNGAAATAFMSWYNNDPLAKNLRTVYGNALNTTLDGIMQQTVDTVSKGDEVELIYNPRKNWRIAANVARQSVMTDNSSSDAFELLNTISPVLKGAAGQVWVNQSTRQTWQQVAQSFVNTIDSDHAKNGQAASPELRKYRFNALTNYSFDTGLLKGFGVGGAVRYGSRVLIGTGYVYSTQLGRDVPNYNQPYYGPDSMLYDGWLSYTKPNAIRKADLTLQLNVRNIGVSRSLIPVAAQPDGSIAQYRIAEPCTWTLSAKLNF